MSVDYQKAEDLVAGIVEDGAQSSKDVPRILDVVEARNGGFRGCRGEIRALHGLLVAMLYSDLYRPVNWREVLGLIEHLKELQAREHAEGRDMILDELFPP